MKIIKFLILLLAFPLMSYADSSVHKVIIMQGYVIDQSVKGLGNLEICNNSFLNDSRCLLDYKHSTREKTAYSMKLFSDDKVTMNVSWEIPSSGWWEDHTYTCSIDLITKGNSISAVLTTDPKHMCLLIGDPNTDKLQLFIRYEG